MNDVTMQAQLVRRLGPSVPQSPVIVSAPHSGRHYPHALLTQSRLGKSELQSLEDRYVDKLVEPLAERGFVVVVAHAARAWIDINRSEREVDPDMVAPSPLRAGLDLSAKVRGGLGIIPRRLAGHGNIYAGPIEASDLSRRIATVHRPYHDTVSDALAIARKRFGTAVLLDCHSMPPLRSRAGQPPAEIVIGDRDGRSAAPCLAARVARTCDTLGFRTAHNKPYAGGHILARHAKPERDIHGLQLELCRSLYLEPDLTDAGHRFDEIAGLVEAIAYDLAEEAIAGPESLAAE